MPEGPELHLASLFVNRMCEGVVFTGAVRRSEVSKSPAVPFSCEQYRITATSRGKEVMLTLTPIKGDADDRASSEDDQPMHIVFRFGMSGFFRFTSEDQLPKHAHLRFYSREDPCRVLSYVDPRRFGSWQPHGAWQPARGPCVMFEYQRFRDNVLTHLSDRAFDRPICEALLNQKYFNGIGNYLRAEILFRLNIPPFVQARKVLEGLSRSEEVFKSETAIRDQLTDTKTGDGATKRDVVKVEDAEDLLSLCHTVPLEVVHLGGKGYDPEKADHSDFEAWLKCYYVDGMKSIRDHNGRTMWFTGDPGPMAPKDSKSSKAKKRAKKDDHDYEGKKKVANKRNSNRTKQTEKQVKQEPTAPKQLKKDTDSKRRKSGRNNNGQILLVNTDGDETRPNARRSRERSSSASQTQIPQRRSGRLSRQRTQSPH